MRKPLGYWQDIENVRKHLDDIIAELGKFPTITEIDKRNSGLKAAIYKYYGGITAVKIKLGYEDDKLGILKEMLEEVQDE